LAWRPARPCTVEVLNARASGVLSQLLCGLDRLVVNAATHGIKVVNMSISAAGADDGNCGRTNGEALHRAICALTARGVLVVAAAGSSSAPLEHSTPAAYGEVLAVTATADTDGRPGGLGAAPTCVKDELGDHPAFSNFATTAAAEAHTVAAGRAGRAGRAGPCARLDPAGMFARLAADGLTGADGFAGDPSRGGSSRYFGPL